MDGNNNGNWNGTEVVEAEYKVSTHCNACERKVVKAISKLKGVEMFTTDMANDRVVISGRIDPDKVLKKLKKRIGKKKVEIVVKEEEEEGDSGEDDVRECWKDHYYGEGEAHLMFNDENTNSCTIM